MTFDQKYDLPVGPAGDTLPSHGGPQSNHGDGGVALAARYQTAAEYAYEQIKRMIIQGELVPDERINQDQLAERLQLSRLPLRTALERLEAEGFVILLPHRGALVCPLSLEEFDEIQELRLTLEQIAVRHAVPRLRDDDLDQLEGLIEKAEAAMRNGDLDGLMMLNRSFHFSIYRAAARPILLGMIDNLWDRHERYRRIFLGEMDRAAVAVAEHREILALLRARNAEAAARFLERHYHPTAVAIRAELLKDNGEGGGSGEHHTKTERSQRSGLGAAHTRRISGV